MKKAIVIIGKSASGKTAFAKDLSISLGVPQLVTYTTRPSRKGEINGKDYNFINYNDFKNEDFIAVQEFDTQFGKWKYGMKTSEIEGSEYLIIVATPSGYLELKEKYGDKVHGIYIMAPRYSRFERYIHRGNLFTNQIVEAYRRFVEDEKDFDEFEFKIENIIINNKTYNNSFIKLHELVKGVLEND